MRYLLLLCAAITPLAACDYRQDLGDPADGGAKGDSGAADLPVLAVWEGYVEQPNVYPYDVDHGDNVRIVIYGPDPSAPTAIIQFGDPAAVSPPPPASADQCYPEPEDWRTMFSEFTEEMVAGVRYAITDLTYSEVRLKGSFSKWTAFDPWCRLQVPMPYTPGSDTYNCLPNTSAGGNELEGTCYINLDGDQVSTPCCKIGLCHATGSNFPSACACTSTSCTFNPDPTESLDLSINGDRADGSWDSGGMHLVRKQ